MHLKLRIKIRMRQLFCMKIDKNFLRAVAMPLKSKVYVKLLEKKTVTFMKSTILYSYFVL